MNTFLPRLTSLGLLTAQLAVFTTSVQAQTANCPNADFSMGNFTNWTGSTGSCCPINVPTAGIVNGRHTIMTVNGNDPNTGNALPYWPPGLTSSARLGNNSTGAQAEGLTYTLPVTASNALFIYRYAVVLEDPGHSAAQQPRFEIQVNNPSNQVIPCTYYQVASASNIPGFQTYGGVRWRPWTQVGVDLSSYIGSTVTIVARTGDCSQSGHYGYAYLSATCEPMQIQVSYCIGDTIAILNAPPGFQSYQWSTGSTAQQIVITNPAQVTAPVSVTVTSVTGCQATLTVNLTPALVTSQFTASNGCNGQVAFTDQSLVNYGFISQWSWDFGDGTTSTQQNPTHVYTQPGTYNVYLQTTSDGGCTHDTIIPVTVPPLIQAGLNIPANGCGLNQTFIDQTQLIGGGTLQSTEWFVNNNSVGQNQPQMNYTFSTPGTYTVSIISVNNAGCSDTAQQQLTVYDIPVAQFTAPSQCSGTQVTFTDQSSVVGGGLTGWAWNFGDGGTGNTQNTTHSYANPGQYNAQLVVTGPGGCTDTMVHPVNVHPVPVPNFTLPVQCNLNDNFINTSTISGGSIASNVWDFGDGTATVNTLSPTHQYVAPGTYTVTLTVTSDSGCVASIQQQNTTYDIPVAAFSAPPVCHGNPTVFTDNSTCQGGIVSQQWDFGDGTTGNGSVPNHNYVNPGPYTAQLIVTGNGGCTDTVSLPIYVPATPVANFVLPTDCGVTNAFSDASQIQLDNITQWGWSFGDNTYDTGNPNPVHTYPNQGTWNVTLIVVSDQGCADTLTQQFTNKAVPVAAFSAPPVCFGSTSSFTDQSQIQYDIINQWNWTLGNGLGGMNQQHGTFPFPSEGTYPVQLIVTASNGCADTIVHNVVVHPMPQPAFTAPPVCRGVITQFTDQSQIAYGNIVNWSWNLVQNNSVVQHPFWTYSGSGDYPVDLTVTSDQGCVNTITQPVTVWPRPQIDFDVDVRAGCVPLLTNFTVNAFIPVGSITAYSWDFGDDGTGTGANPGYLYMHPGVFDVSLYAISNQGCDTTVTKQSFVTVYPKPVASFNYLPAYPTVLDPVVQFKNLSIGETSYNWNFGDGTAGATIANPQHMYPADTGTWYITLEVTNEYGCKDTVTGNVTIKPDWTVFIPNTFTPNGNGDNEAFKIYGEGIKTADLYIFDRWGDRIALLSDKDPMTKGWDGMHGGKIVKEDIYVYKAVVIDIFGKSHEFRGQVNVIR